jgi:hypothetical protein
LSIERWQSSLARQLTVPGGSWVSEAAAPRIPGDEIIQRHYCPANDLGIWWFVLGRILVTESNTGLMLDREAPQQFESLSRLSKSMQHPGGTVKLDSVSECSASEVVLKRQI